MRHLNRRETLAASGAIAAAAAAAALPDLADAQASVPSGILCVASNGKDANSGANWNVPLLTIQKAISLNSGARIMVGAGSFNGGFTIPSGCEIVGVRGLTEIVAPNSGSCIVMDDESFLRDVMIGGNSATYNGTLLEVIGQRCHVDDIKLQNNAMGTIGSAQWQKGYGGTGIYTHEGEGCLFTNISFTAIGLAMLIDGANHVFENTRGDQCFKILNYEASGNSGGHVFLESKFVNCGNSSGANGGAQVETVQIGPAGDTEGSGMVNGNSYFLMCDWDEGLNSLHTVGSFRNVFEKCAWPANNVCNVPGNFNTFRSCSGVCNVTGNNNTFWDHYQGSNLTFASGTTNYVFNPLDSQPSGPFQTFATKAG